MCDDGRENKKYKGEIMTRSITITNTSNWDEEDYRVRLVPDSSPVYLKPGESMKFYPQADIQVEEADSKKSEPFMVPSTVDSTGRRRDKQVTPQVHIIFE